MKLLTIIFSLVCLTSMGQSTDDIIKFVDDHMGQKVGGGVCYELVLNAYGKKNYCEVFDSKKHKVRKPQPGDIFCTKSHMGIVYKVYDDKGNIQIAEQNVQCSIKKSAVVLSYMNYKDYEKRNKNTTVNFYRP